MPVYIYSNTFDFIFLVYMARILTVKSIFSKPIGEKIKILLQDVACNNLSALLSLVWFITETQGFP